MPHERFSHYHFVLRSVVIPVSRHYITLHDRDKNNHEWMNEWYFTVQVSTTTNSCNDFCTHGTASLTLNIKKSTFKQKHWIFCIKIINIFQWISFTHSHSHSVYRGEMYSCTMGNNVVIINRCLIVDTILRCTIVMIIIITVSVWIWIWKRNCLFAYIIYSTCGSLVSLSPSLILFYLHIKNVSWFKT